VETIKRCVEAALDREGPPVLVSTFLAWNPQKHLGAAGTAFLDHVRIHVANP